MSYLSHINAVKSASIGKKVLLLGALGWVISYLAINISAIGYSIQYFTGFNPLITVGSLLVATLVLKAISHKGSIVFILSAATWFCLSILGTWWAITLSNWSLTTVIFLTGNLFMAIVSRLSK